MRSESSRRCGSRPAGGNVTCDVKDLAEELRRGSDLGDDHARRYRVEAGTIVGLGGAVTIDRVDPSHHVLLAAAALAESAR